MDSLVKSTLNQNIGRRTFVAGTAALLSTGMITSHAAAAAKVIRNLHTWYRHRMAIQSPGGIQRGPGEGHARRLRRPD